MARAAATADAFNAVGDPTRRRLLATLASGEATVGELVERLALSQPQVSKHLRVLREVDLVRCEPAGRHRRYRVHAPALEPVETWLAELTRAVNARYDRLDDHLAALQAGDLPATATTTTTRSTP